jgi:hypothetical protein
MSGKKTGSVDELRDDIETTRGQLGETAGALADKADMPSRVGETARRHPVGLGTILAGVVAAVAAIGALRWRKSRQKPKNKAKRMWRDAKGKARDVKKDVEGRARKVKDRIS